MTASTRRSTLRALTLLGTLALAAGLSEAHGGGPGALPVRQHTPVDAGAEASAKG